MTTTAHTTRRAFSLSDARREFWKHPSPWIIAATLVAALAARVAVGDWQITDAIVPVVMIAGFPFLEWVIHVFILHWRPRRVGGVTVDPLLARKHREHHVDPRDVPLIFIPWQSLLLGGGDRHRDRAAGVSATRDGADVLGLPRGARYWLRVEPLPHPQRLQAENQCLSCYLAPPPASPLQERALLVHRHQCGHRGSGLAAPRPLRRLSLARQRPRTCTAVDCRCDPQPCYDSIAA